MGQIKQDEAKKNPLSEKDFDKNKYYPCYGKALTKEDVAELRRRYQLRQQALQK